MEHIAEAVVIVGIAACLCFGCGSCQARKVEARAQLVREMSDRGKTPDEIEKMVKLTE